VSPRTLQTVLACSSISVRNQVSHPYRTTCKIMVFFFFFLKFLERGDEKSEDSELNNSKTVDRAGYFIIIPTF
jgi:hypothetical protein